METGRSNNPLRESKRNRIPQIPGNISILVMLPREMNRGVSVDIDDTNSVVVEGNGTCVFRGYDCPRGYWNYEASNHQTQQE
jgi:hypothetical protein